jgi:hypothetical protein
MNRDSKLIFEAYVSRQLAASDFEKNLNADFAKIPVGLQKFYRSFAKYLPDEIPGKESLNDIVRSLQNYREDSQTKQLPDVPAGKQEKAILDDLVNFGILTKKSQATPETEEPKEVETLDSDEDTGEGDIDVAKELGYDPGQLQ